MSRREWNSGRVRRRPDGGGEGRSRSGPGRRARASTRGGASVNAVAAMFRTLGDPTRLRILCALAATEACVHELCDALAMSQPAVSHQLRLLRLARLVRSRRQGREVFYALDDAHVMDLMALVDLGDLVTRATTHARSARRPATGRSSGERR